MSFNILLNKWSISVYNCFFLGPNIPFLVFLSAYYVTFFWRDFVYLWKAHCYECHLIAHNHTKKDSFFGIIQQFSGTSKAWSSCSTCHACSTVVRFHGFMFGVKYSIKIAFICKKSFLFPLDCEKFSGIFCIFESNLVV